MGSCALFAHFPPEEGPPVACPMGHDGWPHPFVGGATHQLNPLKPHVQRISKILSVAETGDTTLVIVLWSRQFLRLRNAFKYSVFEASKWVSTRTLLLKHYYRHQGREVSQRYECDTTPRQARKMDAIHPLQLSFSLFSSKRSCVRWGLP